MAKRKELTEMSPPDVLESAPAVPVKARELPVLVCPNAGKVEQVISPPIRVFIKLANGALMPGKVVAYECNSGKSTSSKDEGEPYSCRAPGQTLYIVETAEKSLGNPAVRGTFAADQLQVRD